jgi:uncharacterized protein YbjQ (UPF0145 family)
MEVIRMIVVSCDHVPGMEISEAVAIVKGSAVATQSIGKDLIAGFKAMSGGELAGYSELLENTRSIAFERMISEAEKVGADAVVSVRFESSNVMPGSAEILAYGTAVRLSQEKTRR